MGEPSFIFLLFILQKRDSAARTEAVYVSWARCLLFVYTWEGDVQFNPCIRTSLRVKFLFKKQPWTLFISQSLLAQRRFDQKEKPSRMLLILHIILMFVLSRLQLLCVCVCAQKCSSEFFKGVLGIKSLRADISPNAQIPKTKVRSWDYTAHSISSALIHKKIKFFPPRAEIVFKHLSFSSIIT